MRSHVRAVLITLLSHELAVSMTIFNNEYVSELGAISYRF
jgi:hypothetical protein